MFPERPTLPSLHTLDLPTLTSDAKPRVYLPTPSAYDFGRQSMHAHAAHYTHVPRLQRQRQLSTSTTTTSRTPSPPLSESEYLIPPAPQSESKRTGANVRLIPCSFEEADAVVVVPPPSTCPDIEPSKALLLVGPALNHLRHPQRQIAKGARIRPYRFSNSRKNSEHTREQIRRVSTSSDSSTLSSILS
ncbi:hypothetical protein Moror_6992 [Moniliophthora roreri MCA 2997]|uniref:Uncharacterized protein n=2 Tax=Moniliophthora roreri TaxID=221103 RepID=V2YXP2_MONRO|nr:hypothetical protein Moror_6992 [Moniliophthora roreri MCA 2997]KAI3619902.1 hypothetical protein WG66_002899 [Moniliophthora roreri]